MLPASVTVPTSAPVMLPDAEFSALERAAELAALGAGTVLPNPVVGCVLLDPSGAVIAEGHHERAGGPHAEVVALAAAGPAAQGATAVVSLEPCAHHGRTPPCTEALIAAGVRRVVIGVRDPFRPAAGGLERLQAAGISVVDASGTAAGAAASDVNRVWLTAVTRESPFVTAKTAMTVDGRVAASDGTSRWISSELSRADVHRLREQVDTIMVGVGTVLSDDAHLTVRDADGAVTGRQPLRVVLDSTGRTPDDARIRDDASSTLIATSAEFPGDDGRVDLAAVLAELYRRDRRHVLLEGGPTLLGAALDAGLVDEWIVYVAPSVLGAGRPAVVGGRAATLADAHATELVDVTRFGPDVRLTYRFAAG